MLISVLMMKWMSILWVNVTIHLVEFCTLFITTNNDFKVALLNPNSSDLFLYLFYFIACISSFCMCPFLVINWRKCMACVQQIF